MSISSTRAWSIQLKNLSALTISFSYMYYCKGACTGCVRVIEFVLLSWLITLRSHSSLKARETSRDPFIPSHADRQRWRYTMPDIQQFAWPCHFVTMHAVNRNSPKSHRLAASICGFLCAVLFDRSCRYRYFGATGLVGSKQSLGGIAPNIYNCLWSSSFKRKMPCVIQSHGCFQSWSDVFKETSARGLLLGY